jgi:hypothetical protein
MKYCFNIFIVALCSSIFYNALGSHHLSTKPSDTVKQRRKRHLHIRGLAADTHTITHSHSQYMFKVFTIILAASVVSAAPTRGQVAKLGSFNKLQERGDATYYNPSDPNQNHGYVNMGSCGPITDESMMVALSPSLGEMCGTCVSIRHGSNCVNAIVQDKCASCAPDHIDVTPAVFSQLAPLEAGQIKVDWDFSCSCPGGNIAQTQSKCTASNDFTQCSTGCCHEGTCAASEVCFGY